MKSLIRSWCASVLVLGLITGCAATRHQPSPPLRVMTYNIHTAIGMDRTLDLSRIAAVINQHNPDLVALQELDRGTTRTQGLDEPAELARLTGMHVQFGKTIDHQGGQYGIGILSRYPIQETTVHRLPFTPGREPRIALAATIAIPGRQPLLFICTHLDHTPDEQDSLPAARLINELFGQNPRAILAGDLNKTPQTTTIHTLLACWTNTTHSRPLPTFPSREPDQQIDYILYRPPGAWRVVQAQVIDEKVASDHRPLLVQLHEQDEDAHCPPP